MWIKRTSDRFSDNDNLPYASILNVLSGLCFYGKSINDTKDATQMIVLPNVLLNQKRLSTSSKKRYWNIAQHRWPRLLTYVLMNNSVGVFRVRLLYRYIRTMFPVFQAVHVVHFPFLSYVTCFSCIVCFVWCLCALLCGLCPWSLFFRILVIDYSLIVCSVYLRQVKPLIKRSGQRPHSLFVVIKTLTTTCNERFESNEFLRQLEYRANYNAFVSIA